MARSFSQEARSDSQKIGEMRYRMSHLPSTTAIARTLLLAGILLAVTVLATRSFFPAFAQTALDPEEIEYAENGMNPVATFTADDPEGANIDWTLGGDDAALFTIAGGVLSFLKSPDYENPKSAVNTNNLEGDNVYHGNSAGPKMELQRHLCTTLRSRSPTSTRWARWNSRRLPEAGCRSYGYTD